MKITARRHAAASWSFLMRRTARQGRLEENAVCEATVILSAEGHERKIMENVVAIRQDDDGNLLLADLLGEQRLVRARVRDVDFLRHRIVLEENGQ